VEGVGEKPKPRGELAKLVRSFAAQLLAPAAVGVCTGACVAGLAGGVEQGALRELASLPGVLPALFAPPALLLTWLVGRYVTRAESPATSELYIVTYHEPGGRVPLRQLPGRILAATATVGLGGSQGFESTSALIGAAWSDLLARCSAFLAVSEDTRRSLLAAGAGAGIAAIFSSPAVGALYGIEVPFKRAVDAPRLAPCAVAAVCSYQTRAWLLGAERLVRVEGLPRLDEAFLLGCVLVALACGLAARLFARAEEGLRVLGRKQSRGLRALTGGAVLGLLAASGFLLCDAWITFGSGYVAAGWLLAEPRPLGLIGLALCIRAAGNLVCVYGGGGGGVFTSLACNGAFLGEAVARLLRCDETHTLALLGAACFLGAGYLLPLACMLFVAEAGLGPAVTGLGLVTVATAWVLMGDASVSEAQVDRQPG
jgi:CIC family chloride channel protein